MGRNSTFRARKAIRFVGFLPTSAGRCLRRVRPRDARRASAHERASAARRTQAARCVAFQGAAIRRLRREASARGRVIKSPRQKKRRELPAAVRMLNVLVGILLERPARLRVGAEGWEVSWATGLQRGSMRRSRALRRKGCCITPIPNPRDEAAVVELRPERSSSRSRGSLHGRRIGAM